MSITPSLSELRANLYYGLTGTSQIIMYEPSPESLVIKDFNGIKNITYISFDTTNNILNVPTGTVLDISSANITNLNVTNFTGTTNFGITGSTGLAGFQGYQGIQGVIAIQGIQANQGIQGFQGNQGLPGSTVGNQGRQGPQGFQGFQGGGALVLQNDGVSRLITSNNTSTGGIAQTNLTYILRGGISRLTVGGNISATGLYIQSSINYTGGNTGTINSSISQNFVSNTNLTFGNYATYVAGTNTDIGYSISIDANKNSYVTGSFSSPATIYNSDKTVYTTLSGSGGTDCFVVKYGTTGMGEYALKISGANTEVGYGISVNSTGEAFITGNNGIPCTFYNSDDTIYKTITSSAGGFLIKYDTTGTGQFLSRISGSSTTLGRGIAIDLQDNSYIVGDCTSTSTIFNSDGSIFKTLNASGNTEFFTVKYGPTGMAEYVSYISGSNADSGNSVAVDNLGNSYVTGSYRTPANIYNSDGTIFKTLSGSGTNDGIMVKYGPTGMAQFSIIINGTADDEITGVAVSSDGEIFLTGYFNTLATFYNSDSTVYRSITGLNQDMYVTKYSSVGVGEYICRLISLDATNDSTFSISSDIYKNVYVTGREATLSVYNSDDSLFKTIPGGPAGGAFIVKYGSTGMAEYAINLSGGGTDIGYGIIADNVGNIYTIGKFSQTLTLYNGDDTVYQNLSVGGSGDNAYIVKYSSPYNLKNFNNISANDGKIITLNNVVPGTVFLNLITTSNIIYATYTFTSFITLIFYNGSWYVLAKN